MARSINRLTDLKVRREKAPGLYHDGGGLYLQVTPSGAKSWVLRYMLRGKAREMGLGSVALVSLADARTRAVEARRLCLDGIDPIDHRRAERDAKALADAKAKTFEECFEAWMKAHSRGWSEKYESVQRGQMATYAIPVLGSLPVAAIDTGLVLKVLEPIWATKTVTAKRVRENIEAVLDYAKAHGYRTGENPARWKGHLKNLLAKPRKLHKVKHRPALPYRAIGSFMTKLRTQKGRDADALEFIILTAARVNEVEGATFDERVSDPDGATFDAIDFKEKVWSIPGEHMKGGELHRVPLSAASMAVIERLEHRTGPLFPKVSDKSLERLRHRLGYGHITTHGFRSTFRDWAAERTHFARELAEKALAHKVGDETERAYQRGDLLDKRRKLMDSWAKFCAQPAVDAKVILISRKASDA
jgi:integrase